MHLRIKSFRSRHSGTGLFSYPLCCFPFCNLEADFRMDAPISPKIVSLKRSAWCRLASAVPKLPPILGWWFLSTQGLHELRLSAVPTLRLDEDGGCDQTHSLGESATARVFCHVASPHPPQGSCNSFFTTRSFWQECSSRVHTRFTPVFQLLLTQQKTQGKKLSTNHVRAHRYVTGVLVMWDHGMSSWRKHL